MSVLANTNASEEIKKKTIRIYLNEEKRGKYEGNTIRKRNKCLILI